MNNLINLKREKLEILAKIDGNASETILSKELNFETESWIPSWKYCTYYNSANKYFNNGQNPSFQGKNFTHRANWLK